MLSDVAVDEIIVGVISLLSVVAGTLVQRGRKPAASEPTPDTDGMGSDDLRDALTGLSQENRRLRARLESLEGRK